MIDDIRYKINTILSEVESNGIIKTIKSKVIDRVKNDTEKVKTEIDKIHTKVISKISNIKQKLLEEKTNINIKSENITSKNESSEETYSPIRRGY